jgi:hypothetical protein
MTRQELIERLRRQVYGGFPSDDSSITDNLVNKWIIDGTAIAAKQNYKENFQLDGVAYVNSSFYSTFKEIAITNDEQFLYKFTLPSIPLGVGSVDGISRIVFKDTKDKISYPAVILSENQVSFQRSMRPIPNKILTYPEGGECFIITTLLMDSGFTASVTMISGGNDSDLASTINIPNDYVNVIVEYVKVQLAFERNQPVPSSNDGTDAIRTT